ncbi:uncharacterized protein YeaC [Filimonas sp.]|nr:uncharacterized protein YeaC [Filimonas sp.]
MLSLELNKAIVGQKYMLERPADRVAPHKDMYCWKGYPVWQKPWPSNRWQRLSTASLPVYNLPRLLPADIVGTMIYNQQQNQFQVRKGPIFANFILADEINRAPAKVQSALLEAMQERQITLGENTYSLEEPYLVLATQNPIEQEGTYPLPEAQVDRFMLKIVVGYPQLEEERMIIRQNINPSATPKINPIITPKDILDARNLVREVYNG